MTIVQNGDTLQWDGTVTLTNATDISTGVATLMLTPTGGVGTLPALAQGFPGLPPVITMGTVSTVNFGNDATATLTKTSNGGPGVASAYTLDLSLPEGQQGPAGTMEISTASDITGGVVDQYILKYESSDGLWHIVGELCGDTYNAVTFTAASGNTTPQTLATLTIPGQPFDWRPDPRGFGVPSGTANTHVDLRCVLNNANSGDQVGYGPGVTGAGSAGIPAFPVTLIQSFGSAIGAASYGRVPKGQSATFYFQAIQTAGTSDGFSVPASPASFTVKVDPIPGTS